jgi:hypothetical protein
LRLFYAPGIRLSGRVSNLGRDGALLMKSFFLKPDALKTLYLGCANIGRMAPVMEKNIPLYLFTICVFCTKTVLFNTDFISRLIHHLHDLFHSFIWGAFYTRNQCILLILLGSKKTIHRFCNIRRKKLHLLGCPI